MNSRDNKAAPNGKASDLVIPKKINMVRFKEVALPEKNRCQLVE